MFFPKAGFLHLTCASALEDSGLLTFPPGQINFYSTETPLYMVASTHCLSLLSSLLTLDLNTKMCCKLAVTPKKLAF